MYLNALFHLGYYFYNHGNDIWVGNNRGNTFSRNHTTLDPDEGPFWQFSWHEMGMFDLPAIVDFILNYTKQEQLHYVGHSQGGTIVTILLSERPEYNDKIASVHMIAGAVFVVKNAAPTVIIPILKNIRELMVCSDKLKFIFQFHFASFLRIHSSIWFQKLVRKNELFECFSHKDSIKIAKILAGMCTSSSITELCNYGNNMVMGTTSPQSFYDVNHLMEYI